MNASTDIDRAKVISQLKTFPAMSDSDLLLHRPALQQPLSEAWALATELWGRNRGQPMRRADDFFDGIELAHQCRQLYNRLPPEWLLERRQVADCWSKSTLAVAGHYHHLVGPAMLAAAEARLAMGESSQAKDWYCSVIEDFKFLLEDCETDNSNVDMDSEDRQALACLGQALAGWLALDAEKTAAHTEYRQLAARLEVVLQE